MKKRAVESQKSATLDRFPALREALVSAQFRLAQERPFSLVLVIAGVECSGRGALVNRLSEWMDPRHIDVHAALELAENRQLRPTMRPFWAALPPRGKVGIFFTSWYTRLLKRGLVSPHTSKPGKRELERILGFEKLLASESVMVLKIWLHLSLPKLKKRLQKLKTDPKTSWKVSPRDTQAVASYKPFKAFAEKLLERTSAPSGNWIVVNADQARYRDLTVGKLLLASLQKRLSTPSHEGLAKPQPGLPPNPVASPIKQLDMTLKLGRAVYKDKLKTQQGRLRELTEGKRFENTALVLVFEGNDAAGKGGAIRRVSRAIDIRRTKIHPIGAPNDEELSRPYFWRFWRRLPKPGQVVIFDRSWYGRVLVERVEGLCAPADWMRAYWEIQEFERELTDAGMVVVKFWLAVTKEEQLRRFKERETIPFKRFKLTEEDWRNRKKWSAYAEAVDQMILSTSQEQSPWVLVEGEDKAYARVKVVKTIADHLERKLESLSHSVL